MKIKERLLHLPPDTSITHQHHIQESRTSNDDEFDGVISTDNSSSFMRHDLPKNIPEVLKETIKQSKKSLEKIIPKKHAREIYNALYVAVNEWWQKFHNNENEGHALSLPDADQVKKYREVFASKPFTVSQELCQYLHAELNEISPKEPSEKTKELARKITDTYIDNTITITAPAVIKSTGLAPPVHYALPRAISEILEETIKKTAQDLTSDIQKQDTPKVYAAIHATVDDWWQKFCNNYEINPSPTSLETDKLQKYWETFINSEFTISGLLTESLYQKLSKILEKQPSNSLNTLDETSKDLTSNEALANQLSEKIKTLSEEIIRIYMVNTINYLHENFGVYIRVIPKIRYDSSPFDYAKEIQNSTKEVKILSASFVLKGSTQTLFTVNRWQGCAAVIRFAFSICWYTRDINSDRLYKKNILPSLEFNIAAYDNYCRSLIQKDIDTEEALQQAARNYNIPQSMENMIEEDLKAKNFPEKHIVADKNGLREYAKNSFAYINPKHNESFTVNLNGVSGHDGAVVLPLDLNNKTQQEITIIKHAKYLKETIQSKYQQGPITPPVPMFIMRAEEGYKHYLEEITEKQLQDLYDALKKTSAVLNSLDSKDTEKNSTENLPTKEILESALDEISEVPFADSCITNLLSAYLKTLHEPTKELCLKLTNTNPESALHYYLLVFLFNQIHNSQNPAEEIKIITNFYPKIVGVIFNYLNVNFALEQTQHTSDKIISEVKTTRGMICVFLCALLEFRQELGAEVILSLDQSLSSSSNSLYNFLIKIMTEDRLNLKRYLLVTKLFKLLINPELAKLNITSDMEVSWNKLSANELLTELDKFFEPYKAILKTMQQAKTDNPFMKTLEHKFYSFGKILRDVTESNYDLSFKGAHVTENLKMLFDKAQDETYILKKLMLTLKEYELIKPPTRITSSSSSSVADSSPSK